MKDISKLKSAKDLFYDILTNKWQHEFNNQFLALVNKKTDKRLQAFCEDYMFNVLGLVSGPKNHRLPTGEVQANFYMGNLLWLTEEIQNRIVGFNKFEVSFTLTQVCYEHGINPSTIKKTLNEDFQSIWDKISEKGQ